MTTRTTSPTWDSGAGRFYYPARRKFSFGYRPVLGETPQPCAGLALGQQGSVSFDSSTRVMSRIPFLNCLTTSAHIHFLMPESTEWMWASFLTDKSSKPTRLTKPLLPFREGGIPISRVARGCNARVFPDD